MLNHSAEWFPDIPAHSIVFVTDMPGDAVNTASPAFNENQTSQQKVAEKWKEDCKWTPVYCVVIVLSSFGKKTAEYHITFFIFSSIAVPCTGENVLMTNSCSEISI